MDDDYPLKKFSRVKGALPGRKPSNAKRPAAPSVPLDKVFAGQTLAGDEKDAKFEEEGAYPGGVYTDAASVSNNGGVEVGGRRAIPPPPCWTPVLPDTQIYYTDAESNPRRDEVSTEKIRPMSEESEISVPYHEQTMYNDAETVSAQLNEGDMLYEYIEEYPDFQEVSYDDVANINGTITNGYYFGVDQEPVQQISHPLPRATFQPPAQTRPSVQPPIRGTSLDQSKPPAKLPTGDRKPLGQHLGTRVIVNGMNTARIKDAKERLRPCLAFSTPPVEPVDQEPDIDPEQFAGLSLKDKMKMFEGKSSKGPSIGGTSLVASQPMGRRNLESTSSVSSVTDIGMNRLHSSSSSGAEAPGQGGQSREGSLSGDEQVGRASSTGRSNEFRTIPPPAAIPSPVRKQIEIPLRSCSWYWDDADRQTCEQALHTVNQNGAFIVRDSHKSDPSRPYTLSVLHEGCVYTLVVRKKSNRMYALASEKEGEQEFTNVPEMVIYHQKSPLQVVKKGKVTGTALVWLKVCF